MARLLETVRQLVQEGRYVVGQHAVERLEERGILEWQAVAGAPLDFGRTVGVGVGWGATPPPKMVGLHPTLRLELTMRIAGERVKRLRWVHTEQYVVAVPVEAVIPTNDPSEPCYESETIQLLREVKERAEHGDIAWLRQHGKVYEAVDAV